MFVEKAPWLSEAYVEPINEADTGYVARNLVCQRRTRMFIELFLNPSGRFLDYAAGYGMFVRLMRDIGYDFRWYDRYCKNLFARGFEETFPVCGPFEAVTAYEVMEHLVDPLDTIAELTRATPCLIFSTVLLPNPLPRWAIGGITACSTASTFPFSRLRASRSSPSESASNSFPMVPDSMR
jgi:2-polyprenyl-3-methyl-5-hydroxy-6-metoxy-1,4-benzoquinol methylase